MFVAFHDPAVLYNCIFHSVLNKADFFHYSTRCPQLLLPEYSRKHSYVLQGDVYKRQPYSSAKDPVNMAGFMIDNIAKGILKQWHLEDMDKISKDKDVVLLCRADVFCQFFLYFTRK